MSQAFKICLEDLINLIEVQMSYPFPPPFSFLSSAIFSHSLVAFIMAICLDLAELKGNMQEEESLYS